MFSVNWLAGDPGRPFEPRPDPYWFFNPLAWAALLLVALYRRWIPAERKPECRFTPTCSVYMSLAIRKYGLRQGGRHGLRRFRRCVGFVPRGEDWP